MNLVAHPRIRNMIVCALTSLAAMAVTSQASAHDPHPRILPPHSHAFGRTYGAWSAAWWRYVLSRPGSSNPLADPTGAQCAVGQSGDVFFLVGAPSNNPVERDQCVVPAGRALFFPLMNAIDVYIPPSPPSTAEGLWNELEGVFGPFSELHASIDGVPVADLDPDSTPYRVCAGPDRRCSARAFGVYIANNPVFPTVPAGSYEPAVADGFYLLLAPLAPGPHTLIFGGTGLFNGNPFIQQATYRLVVRPHRR
jgi:hypothetical protein